jgi:hypothetical protein
MLEIDIEEKVMKWAKREGFLTPKVKFVEAGYPDRLFISPFGHTIFMEFKRPGEEPEPIQYHRLEQLTKRGIPAVWVDSVLEGINVLKASLEASSISNEGDTTTPLPGVGRPLLGSGAGEDINCSGNLQNSVKQAFREKDADRCTPPPSPESVAGRDKEVGGLSGTILHDFTRGYEGS